MHRLGGPRRTQCGSAAGGKGDLCGGAVLQDQAAVCGHCGGEDAVTDSELAAGEQIGQRGDAGKVQLCQVHTDGLSGAQSVCQYHKGVLAVPADITHHIPGDINGQHRTGAQRAVLAADLRQQCVPLYQLLLSPAPFEGTAVIGVIGADHADLVAVIDGGCAGIGELDQRHHILQLLRGGRGIGIAGIGILQRVVLPAVILHIVEIR